MSSNTRHGIYYFEDGNLVLLAETTLFKVHRSLFMFSPFFQEMLSLPQSEDNPPQGSSDSDPIDIGGSDIPSELGVSSITAEDFSDFLSVMLPMTNQGGLVRSPESWGRVLKISTILQFEPIRAAAIMNLLPTADPLLMISLGSDHHHEPLVVEGIKRMCLCPNPLPMDAALTLSAVTFYHLTSAREAIRTHLVRKVTDNAFSAWQCHSAQHRDQRGNHRSSLSCSSLVPTQIASLIIPPTTSTHLLLTGPTGETKPFHDIAKGVLRNLNQLCDSCITTWNTQVERLAEFDKIDEIIKNAIKETPKVTFRGLNNRRPGGRN